MARALYQRSEAARQHFHSSADEMPSPRSVKCAVFRQVDAVFEDGKDAREKSGVAKLKASNCSITWVSSDSSSAFSSNQEVTNNGFRQGITQKLKHTEKAQSFVCRRQILKRFLRLVRGISGRCVPTSLRDVLSSVINCDTERLAAHSDLVKGREELNGYDDNHTVSAESSPTYFRLKQCSSGYKKSAEIFLSHPPFSDWLRSPLHLQKFSLPLSCHE